MTHCLETMLRQWNANGRLIAVHHHPEDIDLNPHGVSVYLTPAAGEDRWIFPLYSRPQVPPESKPEDDSQNSRDAAAFPTLVVIGALEGGEDIAGMSGYLDAGGKLLHYNRHRCDFFPGHDGLYTQHVGLSGVRLMASLAAQQKLIVLWLPMVPNSDYMVCRFTGALILGVEMSCIMVMPERLRALYGFPKDAVITYDHSVTETGCLEKLRASPAKQHERRRQLRLWAVERWNPVFGSAKQHVYSHFGPFPLMKAPCLTVVPSFHQ